MNHTERIHEVARCQRHLTRRLAKQAIETYLELLAEEIAEGQWVDIHNIGKIRLTIEAGSGADGLSRHPRLRTQLRLFTALKDKRYQNN